MHVAICDDNTAELEQVRKRVEIYSKEKRQDLVISCFSISSQLWFEIQERKVADIFILDIAMPKTDGLQLAASIRRLHPNAAIIFLTAHLSYALEGYKVQAHRYIHKPDMQEELEEALDSAIGMLQKAADLRCLVLTAAGNHWHIPHRNIQYVVKNGRRLEVHTSHDIILYNSGIKEFFQKIDDERFIFIDRGCFVNIDHIKQIDCQTAILSDEIALPISRRKAAALKLAITKRWTRLR